MTARRDPPTPEQAARRRAYYMDEVGKSKEPQQGIAFASDYLRCVVTRPETDSTRAALAARIAVRVLVWLADRLIKKGPSS